MAVPFSRTLRALEAESAHRPLWVLTLVGVFLTAWAGWFLLAEVSVYETSTGARLEAHRSSHAIQAPVEGQIVASHLVLDRVVAPGDLLIELNSRNERLTLEVEQARHSASEQEASTLQRQIAAEEKALHGEQRTTAAALDEARSEAQAAVPMSRFAEGEIKRLQALRQQGFLSETGFLRQRAEAEQARSKERSAALAVNTLGAEMRTRQGDRLARIERLRHELKVLDGQRVTSAAQVRRLEFEVTRRSVTSPIAGKVGQLAVLRPGGFVSEGDVLATVVPEGDLHAVAEFTAGSALGRVHPGQRARLRLEGLPWGQYGSLPARVARVASEAQNGGVRVELAVMRDSPLAAHLRSGLGASVDVEVEKVKPAVLLMRAVGRLAGTPAGLTATGR